MRCPSPLVLSVLGSVVGGAAGLAAQGTPVGFAEEFALAADRGKALEQLIPGTEDWYFFHCLHRQNQGVFAEVEPLLRTWIQRHGRTARVHEIEARQALLRFDQDPAAAYAFLQERLKLSFHAERQKSGARPDLPTRLDPALIAPARLSREALARHPGTVDGFNPSAFDWLAATGLDDQQLMSLLRQLTLPDVPNLPALVARNLRHPQSQGFGSLRIHERLLLDQLEELIRLDPQLIANPKWVEQVLRRLIPNADVQWQRDSKARQGYLDALQAFVQRLPSAQNSLKAHVLYHRLQHDLALGAPDRERFLAYLRLPRRTSYANEASLRDSRRGPDVDLAGIFPTGFDPIRDDEPLVRAFFTHFFQTEDGFQPYAEWVQERWLRQLFAETRILAGSGDMERWYSLLDDPGYYEALKARVAIDFPATARRDFGAEEPVAIEVDVKNVPTLLVKVFPIDAYDFLRATGKEVDASIDLDGVIANDEKTWTYTEPPLRRVRRRFEFPQLRQPGTYVVEFLGNGIASRAVIQKGRLQMLERVGAAGHVFTVLDEAGAVVRDATLWCGGREYAPDARGELCVPFTDKRGRKVAVLRRGRVATLQWFEHQEEHYQLTLGVLVSRESLLTGRSAKLLLRPRLTVNGVTASLALLEEPELTITATDQDKVAATRTVTGLRLEQNAETEQEITVPENLTWLAVRLRGKVRNLSLGKTEQVAAAAEPMLLNGIATTPATSALVLGRNTTGYVLDLLGRSGEPKADRAVTLQLRHRDFRDAIEVTLKTDARGRIELGALDGIDLLRNEDSRFWRLRTSERSFQGVVHGVAGETIRVPYQGTSAAATRAQLALVEQRGGTNVRDAFAHVAIADGFVELRDLQPGDYELWFKEGGRPWSVVVRVTAGKRQDGAAVGRDRVLTRAGGAPLHVVGLAAVDGAVQVRLRNAGTDARVHVFATRYVEAFDPFSGLDQPAEPHGEVVLLERSETSYHAGRSISEEYRYILERRHAAKFPGNMLRRPGLLLNPWAVETSASGWGGIGGGGGKFGSRFGQGKNKATRSGGSTAPSPGPGAFPDLDFLPEPARLIANLRPDKDGIVRVPLADLGHGQEVHVLAVDDESTIHATLALAEKPLAPRNRALTTSLDPARHLAEHRQIEFVAPGGTAVIEGPATAKTETYDSLASVFRLFKTLSGNADLDEFGFVLRWPDLSDEDRRREYSRHACHELHFFLYQKDRAFFDRVVRPYLANKVHQTFLDHWLLDADLRGYLDPWAFARLNIVERILLTQRLGAWSAGGARHVRDLLELVAVDPEQVARRFETALKGGALDQAATQQAIYVGVGGAKPGLPKESLPVPEAPPKADAKETKPPAIIDSEVFLHDSDKGGVDEQRADVERRQTQRALYRAPDATRAWVEHNYWHRRIEEHNAALIEVNAFWRDFAERKADAPFCSPNVVQATNSFAEMLLALAVLDLPFKPGQHVTERGPDRLSLRPATPLLLVRKEIRAAGQPEKPQAPILISQDFFRLDDRYRFEGSERQDNFVTGEFLVDVAYGCQVVLTNPGSSPRKLDLLLQIPRGAVPVQRGFYTRGVPVMLGPFATTSTEFAFYFPAAGQSPHYPAHVAREGALLAAAEPVTLNVVITPSRVDTRSWEHVSQDAAPAEVLTFLETQNLQRVDLGRIAWRARDRAFFGEVLTRLRARHVYHDGLWSYSILHGDAVATREYLRHADAFVAGCGRALQSPLLTVDPVERRSYQLVEYEPLFNARAHRFGKERGILNTGLAAQYQSLLSILAYRKTLDDVDWLSVTYYLLLQDRIEEALQCAARINPAQLPARIQHDYLLAYLDFFTAGHAQARGIAERYRQHPVQRWQQMFQDVLNQLDEVDGKSVAVSDQDSRTQQQTVAAASEPVLELEVEARRVILRHQNLAQAEVRYYRLDAEFSFSTSPFVQQGGGALLCVEPARTDTVTFAAGLKETAFDLPEQFRSSNVLVEVRGAGLVRRQAYFASTLAVQLHESYGQLKVGNPQGQPLPKVYVKVYARLPGGAVRFHKDGYTDLRGRFDYTSVSEPGTTDAERFAILLLSEAHGAAIREVAPPGR